MRTIFTRFCCSLLLLSLPAPAAAQAAAFASPVSSAAGTSVSNVVLADMNLDGRLDVVTTNPSNNVVSVLLGLGNGRFAAPLDALAGYRKGRSPSVTSTATESPMSCSRPTAPSA